MQKGLECRVTLSVAEDLKLSGGGRVPYSASLGLKTKNRSGLIVS